MKRFHPPVAARTHTNIQSTAAECIESRARLRLFSSQSYSYFCALSPLCRLSSSWPQPAPLFSPAFACAHWTFHLTVKRTGNWGAHDARRLDALWTSYVRVARSPTATTPATTGEKLRRPLRALHTRSVYFVRFVCTNAVRNIRFLCARTPHGIYASCALLDRLLAPRSLALMRIQQTRRSVQSRTGRHNKRQYLHLGGNGLFP